MKECMTGKAPHIEDIPQEPNCVCDNLADIAKAIREGGSGGGGIISVNGDKGPEVFLTGNDIPLDSEHPKTTIAELITDLYNTNKATLLRILGYEEVEVNIGGTDYTILVKSTTPPPTDGFWWGYDGTTKNGGTLYISGSQTAEANIQDLDRLLGGTIGNDESKANATKIAVQTPIRPKSMANWFSGYTEVTEIVNEQLIDTSDCRQMRYAFENCEKLVEIDMSGWDLSRLGQSTEDPDEIGDGITGLFYGCTHLRTVNTKVKGPATHVTHTNNMFRGCESLTQIVLSYLGLDNVMFTGNMFAGCANLVSIDLVHTNLNRIVSASNMFNSCARLQDITIHSAFNECENFDSMFRDCRELEEVDLTGLQKGSATVIETSNMFAACRQLRTINVHDRELFSNTASDTSAGMFKGCEALVGGEGTTYDSGKIDNEYARIDNPSEGKPGYFTQK